MRRVLERALFAILFLSCNTGCGSGANDADGGGGSANANGGSGGNGVGGSASGGASTGGSGGSSAGSGGGGNVGTLGAYRLIEIDPDKSPFKGPPESEYGGAKHVSWAWHPELHRIYTFGGDYGAGAGAFGEPDMGESFTTNAPSDAQSYTRDSSLASDQYSIDPYASGLVQWRLEQPYLPAIANGKMVPQPVRACQESLVWDSTRKKLWGIQTATREEQFPYHLPDGSPDPWANGTFESGPEPAGTWSWAPNPDGGGGTWTLETTARLVCDSNAGGSFHEGNVLRTSHCDERAANWEYDAGSDRMFAFGYDRLFIFDPGSQTYQERAVWPQGYDYFNPSSSYVAVDAGWIYGVALGRQNGVQTSELVRVEIAGALAASDGSPVPESALETYVLPFSLSPGNVWENANDASAKWQEHAGVEASGGKIVIVKSYDGIVEDGVTKLAVFDAATKTFALATPAPENIGANSWELLPESGEVLMGNNTIGYSSTKLWAYKFE